MVYGENWVEQERRNGAKVLFVEFMPQNFPKNDWRHLIPDSSSFTIPNKQQQQKSTPRDTTVKLFKTKNKEKILAARKRDALGYFQRNKNKTAVWLLIRTNGSQKSIECDLQSARSPNLDFNSCKNIPKQWRRNRHFQTSPIHKDLTAADLHERRH